MTTKPLNTILQKIRRETTKMTAISVILVCLIAGFGIWYIRQNVISTSSELGSTAASDSKAALEEQTMEALLSLVQNKAAISDEKLESVAKYVNMVAQNASALVTEPGRYQPVEVAYPDAANAGTTVAQYRHADGIDPTSVNDMAGLMGNLANLLISVDSNSDSIGSAYIGTEEGVSMSADVYSETKTNVFDPRTRAWYMTACQEDRLIWTDVYDDSAGRGLSITCAMPYKDGTGTIRGVAGAGMLLVDLNEIVLGTKIGKSGYALMLNDQGQMIMGEDIKRDDKGNIIRVNMLEDDVLKDIAAKMVAGETAIERVTIDGRERYIAYCPLRTLPWSLATVLDVEEAIAPAIESEKQINALTESTLSRIDRIILIMAITFALAFVLEAIVQTMLAKRLAKGVSDPIVKLSNGAQIISRGNLDYELSVKTGDELETLSDTFNTMITSIKKITGEKERIGAELNVATQIQASMLPRIFPPYPDRHEFDLYGSMLPAKEVGGDFYDFFLVDENTLAVVMADVSGKGVPAALFMVIAKTLIKNNAQNGKSPKEVFEIVNNLLCENNEAGMFVTSFMGYLNVTTGEFTYVNAGHNLPLIRHGDGEFEWLKARPGFVLAGLDGINYRQATVTMGKGDVLFLYTDGVTEAVNRSEELYSDPRLIETANRYRDLGIKDFAFALKGSIDQFADGADQADDITMLVLRYEGSEGSQNT